VVVLAVMTLLPSIFSGRLFVLFGVAFATERFGRTIVDPEPLRAIVWAIAPFVVRHDNPTEMDSMRAASFGQRLGIKPGTTDGGVVTAGGTPAKAKEVEGGK